MSKATSSETEAILGQPTGSTVGLWPSSGHTSCTKALRLTWEEMTSKPMTEKQSPPK